MSDENISVSVEDSEVDAAIAKLDGALEKFVLLQQQMSLVDSTVLAPAATGSVGVVGSAAGVGAGVAGLSTAQAKVDKLNVDAVKSTAAVEKLADLGKRTDIKGMQSAVYRITRMIPGLREAHRLTIAMKNITLGNVVGLVSLFLLAISIINSVKSVLAAQERERAEYQRLIMNERGFVTQDRFLAWERSTKQAVESYRTREIP